jgi:hypothetical protein
MEWLYALAAAASALSAVLAWIAKIRWSKEFATAKDEIIRSKDAQIALLEREIQGLRELTPMKIREYFLSVRQQLEEYNETLKADLDKARDEIKCRNNELSELMRLGGDQAEKIQLLEEERDRLKEATEKLERSLYDYKEKIEKGELQASKAALFFEPKLFQDVNQDWRNLRSYLSHRIHDDVKPANVYNELFRSYLYLLLVGSQRREEVRSEKDARKEPQPSKDADSGIPDHEELEKELNEYLTKKYGDRIHSEATKNHTEKDPPGGNENQDS